MRALRLVVPLHVLLAGCFAQRVLYHPTDADRVVLAEAPIDLSVVVLPWSPAAARGRNAAAYASQLADLLRSTHAFRSVTYDASGTAAADLVAESTGDYCNSAVMPLFTILTVGIIPTIWTEGQCTGVAFRRRSDAPTASPDSGVSLHIRLDGKAVMWWAALPLALFPGWSFSSGASQASYQQAFRAAIIRRRVELMRLAGR
jgi:hypothetical protein